VGVAPAEIRRLLALPAPSASLRISAGGSAAVALLNDVSKDRK